MSVLEELLNHFERLDNRLRAGARDGDYLKLVKEVLITRREVKQYIACHPGSSHDQPYREKLDRIRNNYGYRIDAVYEDYATMVRCPHCHRHNVALVKYRPAALPPAEFVQRHSTRLKITPTPETTMAGKFSCNDCCSRFDAQLPPPDVRLCEILFEYYG